MQDIEVEDWVENLSKKNQKKSLVVFIRKSLKSVVLLMGF